MYTFDTILLSLKQLIITYGFSFLTKLVAAGLVIFVGFKLISWLISVIEKRSSGKIDAGAKSFIISFISIALKVILIVSGAAILGVPMTAMVTVLGSAGLAIGLALQGSLSNIAGGVIILIFKPFKVGDYISAASLSGTVLSVSIFYTTIVTPDNKKIVIPNGTISNGSIENYSAMDKRRVDIEFTAAYETEISKVKEVIAGVLADTPLISSEPSAPFVGLLRQDASAMVYVVRTWCKTEDYWTVYFELQEKMKKAFDENNISIPYPHLEVITKNN